TQIENVRQMSGVLPSGQVRPVPRDGSNSVPQHKLCSTSGGRCAMSATLVEFPKLEEAPVEAVPQEPAAILPEILQEQRDFIRTYVGYADVLEVPQMMHEAVAVQIIASVLNRNGVRILHGALSYPLDLWIVLLSRSGAGRNTLVTLADPLLEGAKLGNLVRN